MNIYYKLTSHLIPKLFFLLLVFSKSLFAQNRFKEKSTLYGTTNTFIFLDNDTTVLEILVIDKPNYFINLDTLIRLPNGNYKGRSTIIQMSNNQYLITKMPAVPNFKRKPKVPIILIQADATLIARYKKYKENPDTKLYTPQ